MLASRFSGMFLSLISSSIMGRLLSPSDYGLVAMAMSSIILLNLLRDFGLTTAIIQTNDLDETSICGVFWINISIATALATVGICLSPYISAFYHEPKLVQIVAALCLGLVLSTAFSLHSAILRRRLQFAPLMTSEICGQAASLVVGTFIAFETRSYWAIVISTLTYNLVSGLVIFGGLPWLPKWPRHFRGLGNFLKFGANLSIFSFLGFFSNQLGAILIGAYAGAASAGHFNRAQQLLNLSGNTLMQPIGQVALPMLSRLQNDPENYRTYYLGLLEKASLLFFCLGAFIVLEGDYLTQLLLGPKWLTAGLMFRWFGLAVMAVGVSSQNGNVLMSQSRIKTLRNWGIFDTAIRAGASAIGLLWGGLGVAACFSMATFFITVPLVMLLIGAKGPITFVDQVTRVRPGFLIATISIAGGLYIRHALLGAPSIVSILSSSVFVIITAICVMLIDPVGRRILRSFSAQLRKRENKYESTPA